MENKFFLILGVAIAVGILGTTMYMITTPTVAVGQGQGQGHGIHGCDALSQGNISSHGKCFHFP
jgi:hypothetical protein